ncbi:MAG: TetR/AcrR family transcriptional regulator [Kofleriaceae bacterium]|nr:MAG: TetR/AcrR family transcriptional regulator [Kofleriaceae bacterium]MBZ0238390.1 TetR/AcrR family transcriptional regulator [Kofleriaceae bacterium]
MKKAEVTRQHVLDTALTLFREKGFEATTMRDIAKEAGLALGAAYYHFPSKDALLFAFYDANQAATEARASAYPAGEPLRARLGRLFHDRLRDVAPNRALLGAIIPRHANPADPVSAFSEESAAVRARAVALFDTAIAPEELPDETRTLVAHALWMAHLAVLVYFAGDTSPGQRKTHRLADDLLDLAVPLVALARSPAAAPLVAQITQAANRARRRGRR